MSIELVNRLTDEYRWMSTTTTTEEIRSFVENVIEETKKHIANKLVAQRKDEIKALAQDGFFDKEYSSEEIEVLILEALNKL